MFLFEDHFIVAQGRQGFRVPVDHADTTVNQAFVIQVHEGTDDAFRANVIHGERGAFPVAGAAEAAQLLEDDATVLVGPVPSVLEGRGSAGKKSYDRRRGKDHPVMRQLQDRACSYEPGMQGGKSLRGRDRQRNA